MPSHPEFIDDVGIDSGDLFSGFWDSIPPELMSKLDIMLDLSIIVLIASGIYFSILLIGKLFRLIFGSRERKVLLSIDKKLEEIVKKLNKGKHKKPEEKKKR